MSTPTAAHGALPEAEAWAVYWGLGNTRKHSVHFEKATADAVASEIKSCTTEVRPLCAALPVAALAPTTPVPAEPDELVYIVLDAQGKRTALASLIENAQYAARDPGCVVVPCRLVPAATPAQQTQSDAVAGAVPEGWKLVPVEPTDAMTAACRTVVDLAQGDPEDHRYDDGTGAAKAIYAAMLAATPPQQATPSAAVSIKPDVQGTPTIASTAPERIWLDLGEGVDRHEPGVHFRECHEVTWSEDNATCNGIEYVRAALKEAPGGGT